MEAWNEKLSTASTWTLENPVHCSRDLLLFLLLSFLNSVLSKQRGLLFIHFLPATWGCLIRINGLYISSLLNRPYSHSVFILSHINGLNGTNTSNYFVFSFFTTAESSSFWQRAKVSSVCILSKGSARGCSFWQLCSAIMTPATALSTSKCYIWTRNW